MKQSYPAACASRCCWGGWKGEVNMEVVKFTPQEINEAIEGLGALQEIIVPILKKNNFDDMADQDIQQFKKHIMMAKHALIAMAQFLEFNRNMH